MGQYGIPEISESDANGIVKNVYNNIKFVLKVPVANFIFRALANYPSFLAMAWEQVRPSLLTVNLEEAANQLREPRITHPVDLLNWNHYYLSCFPLSKLPSKLNNRSRIFQKVCCVSMKNLDLLQLNKQWKRRKSHCLNYPSIC